MCAGKRRKKQNCILCSCNMALVLQISYKNREPFCHGDVQRHEERAKTSLWDEGLCYRNRAAQQGCGDSERGISLGRIHVFYQLFKEKQAKIRDFWTTQLNKYAHSHSCLNVFFALQKFLSKGKPSDAINSPLLVKQVHEEKEAITF